MKTGLFITVFLLFPLGVDAAICNDPQSIQIPDIQLKIVAEGIKDPVAISHAGDGSRRLFVLEQGGRVWVIENDKLNPKPFLDIHRKVRSGGEKGLLGIAFHPDYKHNGRYFLNYTASQDGLKTIIAEYNINHNKEKVLLRVAQPWGNHNGGQIAFGPDGYLYIAFGDGGSGDDPLNNGQKLSTLLGSIARIDVDTETSTQAYGIPADNPFVNNKNARPEIWAYGLRNPWRFSFDRGTGELYAADVGQNQVEEINIIEKGKNYGWRIMEGPICTPGVSSNCKKQGLELPIYSYTHDVGVAITGGYVYRGTSFPQLCGTYIYGDFVNQAIWGLRYKNGNVVNQKALFERKSALRLLIDYFDDDGLLISTFGEDEDGELYVAAYQSGRIYRIVKP